MEDRMKMLEEKVAELERRIQEQPNNGEMIIKESNVKTPFKILEAYDPN